jgi:glycosyltransferase involved in cell wall biosynthesis
LEGVEIASPKKQARNDEVRITVLARDKTSKILMLKVALCTPWNRDRDGISDYAAHLAQALRPHADVRIVELKPFVNDKSFYRSLADQANEADVVHVQYNYLYFNGALPYRNRLVYFARMINKPLIATIHEVRVGFQRHAAGVMHPAKRVLFNATLGFWNQWSRQYHRAMYVSLGRIIVHTHEQAGLIKGLGVEAVKISVIAHGVPQITAIGAAINPEEAKKELGLAGKRVLTTLGFINRRKGYEVVLESLVQLPGDVSFLIAGGSMTDNYLDKAYYELLIQRISSLGLTERVVITGYLDPRRLQLVMAATDVYIAAYPESSASGALSLAIAYQKPIIASRIPAHVEINQSLPCLKIVEPNNSGELTQAIQALLYDSASRAQLQDACGLYGRQHSYVQAANLTIKEYERIKV